MTGDIDKTDFLILKCLQTANKPLWKNKLHECQLDMFDTNISVQTVGRRVDKLHDKGLITSCITSPDNINRDLIIAFKLTDNGYHTIAQKRRELLFQAVKPAIFEDDWDERPMQKNEFIELICDELRLDDQTRTELAAEYGWKELTSLITLHLVKQQIGEIFTETKLARILEITEQVDDLPDINSLATADPMHNEQSH